MTLLLDTHIWIWATAEPDRITQPVRRALESGENDLRLSPISVWETLLLAERGRLTLDRKPRVWVREALRSTPVAEAPFTFEVAAASRDISLPHQDPADRFIAATAKTFGMTLVTADANLARCADIEVLRNG